MTFLRRFIAVLAASTSLASAAETPPPRPPRPPIERILADIGVDKARADQVAAVLEASHEKARAAHQQIGRPTDDTTRATMKAAMDAIHSDTQAKLAAILSADELARFRAAMPPPPRRGP